MIEDLSGNEIQGSFYERRLVVKKGMFRVSEISKNKGNKDIYEVEKCFAIHLNKLCLIF